MRKIGTLFPPAAAGSSGLSKIQLAVMDTGEANRRALNKDEYRADLRRVEAVALEVELGITPAPGRRYFELIHRPEQLLPPLQTLEIDDASGAGPPLLANLCA